MILGMYCWLRRRVARAAQRASDAKWWVLHRLHPKHRYNIIRTALKPGYYDIDDLMLEGCMALMRRYVEDEHGGVAKLRERIKCLRDDDGKYNGPSTEPFAKMEEEALAIYEWWTVKRPADVALLEAETSALYGRKGLVKFEETTEENGFIRMDISMSDDTRARTDAMRELEDRIEAEETEYLIRMVKIRGGLWT